MGAAIIGHPGLRSKLGLDERRVARTLGGTFMQRLARLEQLRDVAHLTLQQRRLVNLALYSTYWDCVRLELRPAARQLLGLADPASEVQLSGASNAPARS